jgi:cyanophycinase
VTVKKEQQPSRDGQRAGKRPQPSRGAPHGEGATLLSGSGQRPQHMPSRPVPSITSRGWLIPIGGRLESSAIVSRFVELCGGTEARIVVVPLASKFADAGDYYGSKFAEFGATNTSTLELTNRRAAWDRAGQELITGATGVFFTGGNQLKLSMTLVGTPLGETLRKRHMCGLHVAGTSAGAAILSRHMIAFGEEGRMPRAAMVTTSAGLGFTDRFIVDQHFRERDRLGRLLTAVAYNPGLIGLGVDEDTAAFVSPDDCIHVVGSGAVTVVDPAELDSTAVLEAIPGMPLDLPGMQVHVLESGAEFDLDDPEVLAA